MSGSTTNRKINTEPRRRDGEVMDAAAKVFHKHGYSKASVRDVADELGILKGSLYHYIDSKEDLLYRLMREVHAKVDEIRAEAEGAENLSAVQKLYLYVYRHVIYTAEELARASVYHHDAEYLSTRRRKEIFRERSEHESYVQGLIKDAQTEGDADAKLDPAVVARFVFGSFIWIYRWYQPGGRAGPQELARDCAAFIVRGIGADPVPAFEEMAG